MRRRTCAICFCLLLAAPVLASPATRPRIAVALSIHGQVTRQPRGGAWGELRFLSTLHVADTVRAGKGSRVTVYYSANGQREVIIGPAAAVVKQVQLLPLRGAERVESKGPRQGPRGGLAVVAPKGRAAGALARLEASAVRPRPSKEPRPTPAKLLPKDTSALPTTSR